MRDSPNEFPAMNDFESIDPPAFYRELLSSVADFLGKDTSEVFRTMSDLVYSLHGIVKALYRHHDNQQCDEYRRAMEALETLGGNLRGAARLRELATRLKEATDDEHRMGIVDELMVMVKYCHDNLGRR